MVDKFTQDEIHNFREAFEFIDKDRDGIITVTDLNNVMQMLGQSASNDDLEDMIKQSDSSGTGGVHFFDFLELLSHHIQHEPNDEEDMLDCLRALDVNGNGLIKVDTLKRRMSELMEHLTEPELDDMLNKVTANNEGCINYQDFVKTLKSNG